MFFEPETLRHKAKYKTNSQVQTQKDFKILE